ncbi:AAA family ATPase [Devosia sp.]
MDGIPDLEAMGRRIMIMGPSNSGKSTLTEAIGRKLEIEPVYLDLLRHLPNTDWVQRTDADFQRLHDGAIQAHSWIMEGNYSVLLPQRLARATGIIIIGDHHLRRYWRYFRRTLFSKKRPGGMEGNIDSVKWEMVRWIWVSRNSNAKYEAAARAAGLPHVFCRSLQEVKAVYAAWGLMP